MEKVMQQVLDNFFALQKIIETGKFSKTKIENLILSIINIYTAIINIPTDFSEEYILSINEETEDLLTTLGKYND